MAEQAKFLAVTGDASLRRTLQNLLGGRGVIEWTKSADSALAFLAVETFDAVLIDCESPSFSGLDLTQTIHNLLPQTPLLPLTNTESDITVLSEAMGIVAFPSGSSDALKTILDDIDRMRLSNERLLEIAKINRHRFGTESMIGASPPMELVFQTADSLRDTRATALILGESGTGKELLALLLHRLSPNKKAPFVAVNCGALTESLLESELFGHERGSFTGAERTKRGLFEAAATGTLFLDEVGDMSPSLQVKLLRAIDTKRITRVGGTEEIPCDPRIIAATNRNLTSMIDEKKFRQDLYWRLNVVPIELPPLRDRGDDLELLVSFFFLQMRERHRRVVWGIRESAWAQLLTHKWPGNVRELINRVERAVLLTRNRWLESTDFPDVGMIHSRTSSQSIGTRTLAQLERDLMMTAIRSAHGNISKAAKQLGISRTTLYKKIAEAGATQPATESGVM